MIEAANGEWTVILDDLFRCALRTPSSLKDMELDWNGCRADLDQQQAIAKVLLESTVVLAGNRAMSMFVHEDLMSQITTETNRQ